MSYTSSNLANTPPGNITGNTLTTEQYRAAQTGLILQILDNLDHSSGKGLAVKRVQSGLDANKPTGGTAAGTVYVATDTGIVYYDDGTDLDVLATLDNAQTWTAAQTFSALTALNGGLDVTGSGVGKTLTASLGADVTLNNTATYFDGPSVAQGTTGTWFVSGQVVCSDSAGAATFVGKLWDGTTLIASGVLQTGSAGASGTLALAGFLATPAGNLRISVRDLSATTGSIVHLAGGSLANGATITAVRVA